MSIRVLRAPFLLAALLLTAPLFAQTEPHNTNNDDSCDIALLPAATLLLPYFEVDITNQSGETTLFTITNVTNHAQIAQVTLWTDYGFPVIDFNIYLTGYDVQSINLYDVIARGIIAPNGNRPGTGTDISPTGEFSDANPQLDITDCDNQVGLLPQAYVLRLQKTFIDGIAPAFGNSPLCNTVGGKHQNAVGYATIDVVRACAFPFGAWPDYFGEKIAWDNVLTGDFMQVNSTNNYAQGNPLVHIRAIPEGTAERTAPASTVKVNFERTFYSHYQNGAVEDARQPLPSRFVARWIEGGPTAFETSFKIWREARTSQSTTCSEWELQGGRMPVAEIVMFDEEENPFQLADNVCCVGVHPELPSTSLLRKNDHAVLPPVPNGALAGWLYFNLDNRSDNGADAGFASQNWVVTSMRAEGRFSTDSDATALGNGCSPETPISEIYGGSSVIGPSPNGN